MLKNYPIKELENEQYKQSLIDSLNRGNRQKVTFAGKDGKDESLYVSPSITTGSLNVYELNKKIIPLEKLVEKEYIAKDLVDLLKERFGQKQDTSSKQEQTQVEQPQQTQSQALKQQEEKPVKKQTPKQKIK